MESEERSLAEDVKHAAGKYGGFAFGGSYPDGVTVVNPLPPGVVFPNGATAALLLTFDVEGNYGNGVGELRTELANYERICARLANNDIRATFNVVGKMAEEHGPQFVRWMIEGGSEVASHGYFHDLNKRYGCDKVYAGHYGPEENTAQVNDSIKALKEICGVTVQGIRIPYGHFNEFSYDAIEAAGLKWASNIGADDFIVPGQGAGYAPFRMKLGDKLYPIVEIPLDTQTYDWSIWVADEKANAPFVNAVRSYCDSHGIPFVRTPAGGIRVWEQRMLDAIDNQTVFTLLCHPTNLAVKDDRWGDPVEEFLFPVIDKLGQFHRDKKAWVCTCGQLADFYRQRQ